MKFRRAVVGKYMLLLGGVLLSLNVLATPKHVSMTELIIKPEEFNNEVVEVIGYHKGIPQFLYLNEWAAVNHDQASGIRIDPDSLGQLQDCIIGPITVVGVVKIRDGKAILIDIRKVFSSKQSKWCELIPW